MRDSTRSIFCVHVHIGRQPLQSQLPVPAPSPPQPLTPRQLPPPQPLLQPSPPGLRSRRSGEEYSEPSRGQRREYPGRQRDGHQGDSSGQYQGRQDIGDQVGQDQSYKEGYSQKVGQHRRGRTGQWKGNQRWANQGGQNQGVSQRQGYQDRHKEPGGPIASGGQRGEVSEVSVVAGGSHTRSPSDRYTLTTYEGSPNLPPPEQPSVSAPPVTKDLGASVVTSTPSSSGVVHTCYAMHVCCR